MSLASAQAELGALAGHLARTYPATNAEVGVRLEPLHSALVRDSGTMLIVLLAAVIVLLVIASVKVANLLLARGSARERELAVRHTLGASRRVLVRQMLVECLLLSAVSGLLGVAVAAWGVDVLVALAPADLPRFEEIHLDARALAFTVLVSVVIGLVFGSWPAVRASRPDLAQALRGTGRTTGAREQRRTMQALVCSEPSGSSAVRSWDGRSAACSTKREGRTSCPLPPPACCSRPSPCWRATFRSGARSRPTRSAA